MKHWLLVFALLATFAPSPATAQERPDCASGIVLAAIAPTDYAVLTDHLQDRRYYFGEGWMPHLLTLGGSALQADPSPAHGYWQLDDGRRAFPPFTKGYKVRFHRQGETGDEAWNAPLLEIKFTDQTPDVAYVFAYRSFTKSTYADGSGEGHHDGCWFHTTRVQFDAWLAGLGVR